MLDYCCGAGSIAAALRVRPGGSSLKLHLLDADALAIHAARKNVSRAHHWLSDSWEQVTQVTYATYAT